ncbi:response regulator [Humitalea sp. 24SJ18S-53]|uniref:response regulator n=1 Tax=Humitalea sp. 24SJ18S-53 TaxID=3422307 RepID=UPI003D66B094
MGPGVLLFDNEPLQRAIMALALRHEGFRVFTASVAAEALYQLATHPEIAVLVLEAAFGPDAPSGFDFVSVARSIRPELGVIFLTGRHDLLLGRAHGRRERHLRKPCSVARLAEALRELTA